MNIKLIVDGGAMKPGPTVAQQLGPAGVNLGEVISKTNEATAGFKGMKVPVSIEVDTATKQFTISVSSPPVSELIKKECGADKGSGKPQEIKIGNLAIEQIISIAKTKMPDMLAKDLKAAVKLTVGSCVPAGVLIEDKSAKEVMAEIEAGHYDAEINAQKTEADAEKLNKLKASFAERKKVQDKMLAEEAAAEAAKEAKK